MTYDVNTGKYVGTCTIDKEWVNGAHTITVIATDIYGNVSSEPVNFTVNKNEVGGFVALQDASLSPFYRDVTFVLNGTQTRVVNYEFVNGRAYYYFTDIDDLTSISAKTKWHLRTKMYHPTSQNGQSVAYFTAEKGQFVANFTDDCGSVLRGGDLATPGKPMGDNAVNALDYMLLRSSWCNSLAGDITGDGITDNSDYLVMFWNWYVVGDPE